ncbi:TonB-dependent receptor [Aliifodinibius sp. S!AR15-10]|uniref:TonB-dependent receptor n=1 Tax=Aliifodinibius sp. S!AR15-10 TaxID=2950437 RepID=UPI002857C531|nr:TonB-dependent receptor [Aliifodinibius sp. S!AR15-10]MDR8391235.1 TonB-dependent receptor [Aliifodinibius sp. S!AR15-10]
MFTLQKTILAACTLLILLYPARTFSQSTGTISGTITNQNNDRPISDVNIFIPNTTLGTTTDAKGEFRISNVPAGTYILKATFVGFEPTQRKIRVESGQTTTVQLSMWEVSYELSGIAVSALRPDLEPETELANQQVREANPRDSGELLRVVAGVDAVRRGPIGLDPVVRGLRETEVGTYLDGTRIFPAGPARMDSSLSHLDPSAIQSMQVVKGPYALTWGAGNLSAIRVETNDLTNIPSHTTHGKIASGFDSNYNAFEGTATVSGKFDKLGYWLNTAWREGSDYEDGNSTSVPANFQSREFRSKLSYATSANGRLTLGLGYQNQNDVNYPGRLLDANYFDSYNTSLAWNWQQNIGLLQSIEIKAYYNSVDHAMDNDSKPTAMPMEGRVPPFALDVDVDASMDVAGGRAAFELVPADNWSIEVGADIYSANRNAVRTIDRRDEGMKPPAFPLVDQMWPDATITDAGIFTRAEHSLNSIFSAAGTVRLDFVNATADRNRISDFFEQNVSTDLNHSETNLNGAFTLSATPGEHWVFSAGIGSAVRTADATERYSDRIPASKAQTSAEFVGNPGLKPERSTQLDLWIESHYPKWAFSFNTFTRYMENYITIRATDLPKRLPLSPNTVYQYRNGEAKFWGLESSLAYRFISALQAEVSGRYLWGQDETVDEPALGISPFGVDTKMRYEPVDQRFFVEGVLHTVSEQDRVATLRGEQPTDGYTTFDLKGGVEVVDGLSLQLGVNNIFNERYVNHLNANNPFAGMMMAEYSGTRIPEPGRVIFFDLAYTF